MCFIWGTVAVAWDLTIGFAGLFTFSMIAFFTIGAYTTGILTLHHGVAPWLGMFIGGSVAGIVGVLIGILCLKLKGAYIALVTFAIHLILRPLIESQFGRFIGTGGHQGLLRIPPLGIGSYVFSPTDFIPWYYTALAIAFVSLLIIYKSVNSMYGIAFTALRDAEEFAECLGVNKYTNRLTIFALSAFLTGFIGAFYGHFIGNISARILGLETFLIVMVILFVGGVGKFPGAMIGAYIVIFLDVFLRPLHVYRLVIFGAIVILIIIFLPQGFMGIFDSLIKRFRDSEIIRKYVHQGGQNM